MKKKISTVLLASLLVFGLAAVSYATPGSGHHKFNQQETVDSAVKKIVELCAYGQKINKSRQHDNDRKVGKKQYKDKEAVVKNDRTKDKGQKHHWFDKKELTVCNTGNSCQDDIANNGGGPGWDCPTTPGNNPVPEPATMLLLGAGIAGIAGVRLRKKNK